MSKKEVINSAVRVIKAHGFKLDGNLDKQIASLENPQYRVSVVGEFQVGKSTLINRVFLGEKSLLSEGRGSCTTAVATDVEYGDSPSLDVYDWSDNHQTAETLVKTIPNPTENDVNDATVSSAIETRGELAKKRSRIVLKVPNESLRGFTVVDTPGLDDPNEELLLNTTWRIIPNSDVALLVVPARQLGDRVLSLLHKELIGKLCISRLMVLVSYKPSADFDADQRKEILDIIKAQLVNIGRENIAVEMYCFDPAVEDIMSDVSEIRMTIRQFLSDNALPGREEKIVNLLKDEVEKDIVEISAKLATLGKSEAERKALNKKVDDEILRFKEKAELAFNNFQSAVRSLSTKTELQIKEAVDVVFDNVISELEEKESVSAMKTYLDGMEIKLKSRFQDKVSSIAFMFKDNLDKLVAEYGESMSSCTVQWNQFISDEFKIEKPFVAKIPTLAFHALEVVLYNFALPLGWITAIVAKLMVGNIVSPAEWIAKKLVLSSVKKNLDDAKPDVSNQIMQEFDKNIQQVFIDVKKGMESSNKAQVEAIRSALASNSNESEDRQLLESAKADLESVLATLN